jgi:glycerophosphoryl diester phosphodiesterase
MRPRVVAHRGASHDVAEHTLRAYVAALDDGADGLECDVRLTADGHLVCVHDRNLRRTAAYRGIVSTMDLAELDQLDFASWKNPWAGLDDEAPERDDRLDRVLTLRALFETVADYDRRVEIAVETKHPTRYGGLVERRLVELLHHFGWDRPGSPARVMSFSRTALQRVERLAPGVPLVQLLEKAHHWPVLRKVIGPDWLVGPGIRELADHPRLGRRIRDAGHHLHVWTVNTPTDLDLCLELGVEAVITDRPAYLLDLLDQRETPPR